MERRLDSGDAAGSTFYNKILKSDRSFNQFLVAVEKIPGAQQKLSDMRQVFKNIINPVTPRTAARLAKSSLDVPRSTYQAIKEKVINLGGGYLDKAAIELITSNKWDKELVKIKTVKNATQRGQLYANLLSKIATIGTANALNNSLENK